MRTSTLACVLLLTLLLAFAIPGMAADAAPTSQPVQAAKAAPNTWVQFSPTFHGAPSGGRFVAVGWNKMVYDSQGKRAIIMDRWKDDIRDSTIYANAVVAIDAATSRAEVLKLTNHKRQGVSGGGYKTVAMPANQDEPTPVDRHPYGCLTYCDFDNSVYLGPGANRTATPAHPGDLWRLDLKTRTWHLVDSGQAIGGKGLLERVMCYDPANKVIVFYKSTGAGSTWLFDVVKQQWRQPKPANEPKAGMGAAMAYDSKRQLVYLFGGPGSKGKDWNTPGGELWAYSVKENQWKQLAENPVPARAPGLAYNSAHDVLLANIARGKEPNAVMLYDPAQDKWRELAKPDGDQPWPAGTWANVCYDEANDVFVLKSGVYDSLRWLLMHYSPSAGRP